MRMIGLTVALVLAAPVVAVAQTAPAATPAPAYSTSTSTIGMLLENPQTKAVLMKYIPDIVSNDQIHMANGMTLKAIQPYSGDALSDEILAKIDTDLAKVPASK